MGLPTSIWVAGDTFVVYDSVCHACATVVTRRDRGRASRLLTEQAGFPAVAVGVIAVMGAHNRGYTNTSSPRMGVWSLFNADASASTWRRCRRASVLARSTSSTKLPGDRRPSNLDACSARAERCNLVPANDPRLPGRRSGRKGECQSNHDAFSRRAFRSSWWVLLLGLEMVKIEVLGEAIQSELLA